MQRTIISKVLDFIFTILVVFFLSFIWLKFLTKKTFTAFIFSLIVSVIVSIILIFIFKRKTNDLKVKNLKKIDFDGYFLTLLASQQEENLLFFKKIYKPFNPKIVDNILIIEKNNLLIAICPQFNEDLCFTNTVKNVKKAMSHGCSEIYFLCMQANFKTIQQLQQIDNITIKIYDKEQVYTNIFQKHNVYPKISFNIKKEKKINFKQFISLLFQRKKAKNYFAWGLFIFFSSFFVRLNIYYVLFSSALFSISLLCLTIGNKLNI